MNLSDVLLKILGDIDPALYVASLLLAYVSFMFWILRQVMTRNPHKKGTPTEYSGKVFWYENWPRILSDLLVIPILLLVSKQLVGMELTTYVAILIGLGADGLSTKIIGLSPYKRREEDESAQLAIFQESLDDKLVSYGTQLFTPEKTCTQMDGVSGFFLADDDQNITDLCKTDDGQGIDVQVTLRRSDNSTYIVTTQPFIGGRPPHR